jgi:hypothetical protein
MKIKSFLILLTGLFIYSNISAQEIVKLYINKRFVGQTKGEKDISLVRVNKKKFGVVNNLSIRLSPAYIDRGGFKRHVEITDEKDNLLFTVKEKPREMRPGIYHFNISRVRWAFAKHKNFKLYYVTVPESEGNNGPGEKKLLLNIRVE